MTTSPYDQDQQFIVTIVKTGALLSINHNLNLTDYFIKKNENKTQLENKIKTNNYGQRKLH